MTKLLTPTDRPVFTPSDQKSRPEAERITYALRVPTVADQARLNHAVRTAGGRTHNLPQILNAMADGVRHLLPDEADPDRISILAELDSIRADMLEKSQAAAAAAEAGVDMEEQGRLLGEVLGAMVNPRIEELKADLEPGYGRLSKMLADNEVYPQIRGTEAARMFLVEWTGLPEKPRRGVRGIEDASLRSIPMEHRIEIGQYVDTLFGPTETEEKN